MIMPIQTEYNGYRFRSRLEARWAVFFDSIGLEYKYEPEGYEIREYYGEKSWYYLPDFYLPESHTWVEVKGNIHMASVDYLDMLVNMCDWGGQLPNLDNSVGTCRGLLVLSDIPYNPIGKCTVFPCLQHHNGVSVEYLRFVYGGMLYVKQCRDCYLDSSWGKCQSGELLYEYDMQQITLDEPEYTPVKNAFRYARMARFEHGETPMSTHQKQCTERK